MKDLDAKPDQDVLRPDGGADAMDVEKRARDSHDSSTSIFKVPPPDSFRMDGGARAWANVAGGFVTYSC
jgi:hypothetical protein